MKFDVVEPTEEQAVLDEEIAPPGEGEPLPGTHLTPALAGRRTRAGLRDDLTRLGASLGRLHEHIRIAQRRELDEAPAAPPPPPSFRAGAFSHSRSDPR